MQIRPMRRPAGQEGKASLLAGVSGLPRQTFDRICLQKERLQPGYYVLINRAEAGEQNAMHARSPRGMDTNEKKGEVIIGEARNPDSVSSMQTLYLIYWRTEDMVTMKVSKSDQLRVEGKELYQLTPRRLTENVDEW